ncbi:MAG: DUF2829 domain-containing protein [Legionella sp.]|uniref:Thoeris anti-defense Tad2 family protein n=1 Tax=Legionella sp. TaxID=459 RepID=UPI00284A68C3|nr:DUF2829 domain-containing protein [Legionella sp.]
MLDFSVALSYIKGCCRLRRAAWKPNKWVELNEGSKDIPSFIELKYNDGRLGVPWTPTRCDMLECDWEFLK